MRNWTNSCPNRMHKRILLLACGLIMGHSLLAQADIQQRYPFLKLEANVLQFPAGQERMNAFFDRLEELSFSGKGQLNVLHIGGSHVQAGTLSSAMRQGMQQLHPGIAGSRGFFFPMRLAGTNQPANFSVQANGQWEGFRCSVTSHSAQWGVAGIAAETRDADARIDITAFSEDTMRCSFRRIRIFHVLGSGHFRPVVRDSSDFPDSSFTHPHGYTEFIFSAPRDRFSFELTGDSTADRFVFQGIQYLEDLPGLSYHAIGVNGASTKSYLRCADLPDQLSALSADLVILGIGINDAYGPEDSFDADAFGLRYDSLLNFFEAVNPEVVFVFMSNNDSYYKRRYPNRNALKVQQVMKRLAKERGGAYWDLTSLMGGLGSVDAWKEAGLAKKDRIHFTRAGYQLQAQLFIHAFQQEWIQQLRSKSSRRP